jgi:polar amino acid transport system permease protein
VGSQVVFVSGATMTSFWRDAAEFAPILIKGAGVTVMVTICSLVLSTFLGLFWALLRTSHIKVLSRISATFVNIIRGIPILVQLFYIYFVLPDIGIQLTAFQAGTIGLGIAYSAYMSEVFRAGIEAIDVGQIEAAQSIGMTRRLIMTRVVLPQAFRIALPPYGNNLIMLLKDSSQTSAITVAELSLESKLIAASSFKNMTVFTLGAIGYLVMSVPLIFLVARLEKRFERA